MDSQDYLNNVKIKFNNKAEVRFGSTEMLIAYEQIFKIATWISKWSCKL